MSDAITRKETLLKSIANGTSSALKPITREEQYLAYIAGESNSFPTTPITREEAFLDKIAKSGVSGGSSINVQPLTVTENGTWDAPEGQAYDPVVVNVAGGDSTVVEPLTITKNGVYDASTMTGVIKFDTEIKFKEVITEEDFNTYLSNATPNENGMCLIMDGWLAVVTTFQGNTVYMISDQATAGYILNGSAIGYPEGWVSMETMQPLETSPTIIIPSGATMSADLETTSVFFDVPSNADAFNPITVDVKAEGSMLNIGYGDTAPEDTSKLWVKTTTPKGITISDEWDKSFGTDGTMSLLTTMPEEPSTTTTCTVGSKIYLFGGDSKAIRVFDTRTLEFTTLTAQMPLEIVRCATCLYGTKIYLFGGVLVDGTVDYRKIVRFDIATETAEVLEATLPYNMGGSCIIERVGNIAYMAARASNYVQYWYFDLDAETITYIDDEICDWGTITLSACNGKIYLFDKDSNWAADVRCLDLSNTAAGFKNLDTTLGDVTSGFKAQAVCGTKIFFFGATNYLNNIFCFDTETETFTTCVEELKHTYNYTEAAASQGNIYLFGGESAISYDPVSDKVYIFEVDSTPVIPTEKLHIVPSSTRNIFSVLKGEDVDVEIGVSKIYKGNSEGIGEEVEAALHNGSSWITI